MVLRNHLFKLYSDLALFFCLLPFANKLIKYCRNHLPRAQLPHTLTTIATDVTATFMAPFKLNFFVALFIAMPFILYQIWAFANQRYMKKKKVWRCLC